MARCEREAIRPHATCATAPRSPQVRKHVLVWHSYATDGSSARNARQLLRGSRRGESDDVPRVRSAGLLHDVNLRVRYRIHGGVETVRRLAEGKYASLIGISEAWDPGHKQEHHDPSGAIRAGCTSSRVEATIDHVTGVAGEVG